MANKNLKKKVGKNNNTLNKDKDILYGQEDQYYLLQALIDNIPDNIYIKDSKNRFVMLNKTMADFLGKEAKDFIGKTDFDFFPKEKSIEYSKDENLVMKNGKPIIDKMEKVIESGKEFWFSTSKIPWYDRNGNIIGTMGISRDVTKRKKFEESLLGREKSFFNALMNNITDSIFFKDPSSRFVRINRACAIKHGIENPEEVIGKTDFDFFSEEHAKQAFEDEQKVIKTGKPIIDFEEKETYEDREDRWASTSKLPWYDENNNMIGIFGITRDITDKRKAEEKVKYLSFHDGLTGLYNRAYFDEELNRLDTERQLPVTIVMGDLNGLKVINDAYGHSRGDMLLRNIADILKESFRKEDIISRWGGDEFISILPKTSVKDAESIIKRIKELCEEKSTTEIPLSISLGTSTKKSSSENIDDILKEAEDKMYKSKIAESAPIHESLIQSLR
ncbi:MAG: GGDEF domain-containing protein, partial [Candidatus Hydromicrobium sp.]